MSTFAPKRIDGLRPYVITKRSWAREWSRIEYAANLTDAKQQYGWTRERHTTVSVRRATIEDIEANA